MSAPAIASFQRLGRVGHGARRRLAAPIGEMAIAIVLVDHVEARAAAGDLLDMADADVVFGEEIGDLLRVEIIAERRDVIDLPVGAEPRPRIPGGVEGVAGKAEAVGAVLAARHFDHALADADEPFHCCP